MEPYSTHLEALVATALATQGAILELGCGDYSTPVLAAIAKHMGRRFLVQASDEKWAAKYRDIAEVEIVKWSEWGRSAWHPPLGEFGMVFLDSEESTAGRIERLPALATITRTVVMHDADHAMARQRWPYCTEGWDITLFKRYKPWTAVLRK